MNTREVLWVRGRDLDAQIAGDLQLQSASDLNRRKPKGDGGKGTGKKMSRQLAFPLFIPLT